ncbi:MAG TPA: FlgD immunoglobulin-like domain containing protein [Methylomirabilota bacterium]|jgi:hypothetical protein|nr:FlgD immunoglobulin-like domain containing protein [Methylomirabilota bacterium]
MIPRTRAALVRLAIMSCVNACALAFALAAPAGAQTVAYTLSAGAEFRTGCFAPPCTCGPIQLPMTGSFALVRKAPDLGFARYDVVSVLWQVQISDKTVFAVGSGTFRVGGTGTMQQQLTLDLSFGGGPVRHFDSGLVAGGGGFPRLDVDVSLHGQLACADTVLRVRAGPGGATAGVGTYAVSLGSLAPNPFGAITRLQFSLHDAGPVRVSVHDAAGRCLRTLADGAWREAGPNAVDWDGRRDDGLACAPGCYFIRVQAGGRSERTSVIKLR